MPLFYICNFFTVIKAAAEVLTHQKLFLAFREVLSMLTLHHVSAGLLRLCWNAEIALEVWTSVPSIMVRLHFDHLSKVRLVQRLWNVFGFLNRVGSLRLCWLLELAVVNHIFLGVLIPPVGDQRPIAFVRLLGLLPILALIGLVRLLLLLFSHHSRLLQLFGLLLVWAKIVLDGSFLRHHKNPIAHIFYFEVSTCLWAYIPILIDSWPQDNSFVECIFNILLIHSFFVF